MYIWVASFVLEIMEMPFFAAFMIFIILWLWRGWRGVIHPQFIWVLAGIGWVLGLSADDSSSFWKWNGYVITSKHHILRRRARRKREMCAWNVYREECLFTEYVSVVIHQGLEHFPSSLFNCLLHGQGNYSTCKYGGVFSLLCHEMVVPWIPTCGPLTLACEKRGAQVRNRNETQVISPSDTTGRL